ncbi:MAG: Rv3235 family protein [Nocardioidaceae bacterium]
MTTAPVASWANATNATPGPTATQRRWRDTHRRLADIVANDVTYSQGALALSYSLTNGIDAEPQSSALTLVDTAPELDGGIPDAQAWAARFVQAVIEVVSSDRPITQLVRWTDPRVYTEIARRQQRVAAHRSATAVPVRRQQVATVHISYPSNASAEVAARVSFSGRSRAIAARLDFRRGRWQCTAICFG